jgi:hypothetical protein
MTTCKYYDCGFCYAPDDVETSASPQSACFDPDYCLYLKSQMTEKEKIEGEIKILQKKLALLEELEKTKSPCEEAYKRVYGAYRITDIADTSWDSDGWFYFEAGYNAAQEDYKVREYQKPKDNEWKSVALRFGEKLVSVGPCGYYEFSAEEWYDWVVNTYEKLADDWLSLLKKEKVKKSKINDLAEKLLPDDHPYKIADEHGETNPLNSVDDEKKMEELGFVKSSDGNWTAQPLDWVKPQTPEQVADGLKKAFREAINQGVIPPVEKKQKTLTDLIERWWCDVFTTHGDWDMETSIEDLVDQIELFLPKEQIANSQNTYVECSVDGFNDCLNKIKDNLR